jgi:hypothetical protein
MLLAETEETAPAAGDSDDGHGEANLKMEDSDDRNREEEGIEEEKQTKLQSVRGWQNSISLDQSINNPLEI